MEVKIKASGAVVLTDELNEFIEKKVQKIALFLKNDPAAIIEVEVGTTSNGARTGDVYRAEVHATFTGGDVYAEADGEKLHPAIGETIREARRELKKVRGKNRAMVRKGSSQVKDFFQNFGK